MTSVEISPDVNMLKLKSQNKSESSHLVVAKVEKNSCKSVSLSEDIRKDGTSINQP